MNTILEKKSVTANEISKRLLGAPSLQVFLQDIFVNQEGQTPLFSYAEFARRAGFSSRSIPREIVIGSRRLSLSSQNKFIRGLGLSGSTAKIFGLLAMLSHPQLNLDDLSESEIASQLTHDKCTWTENSQPTPQFLKY